MPIPLKFKATLDDSQFRAGMNRIGRAAAAMGRGVGGAARGVFGGRGGFLSTAGTLGKGALAAGALGIGGARIVMRDADALYNLSRKTGMSARSLAALAEMAAGANVELEQVAAASVKMSKALGTKEGKKAVEDLGLSFKDIKQLSPEQQFASIGTAIAKITDQTKKSTAASAFFGRGGSDFFELFDDIGKLDMTKITDNAERIGDAAKTIADASDTIKGAGFSAKAIGSTILKDILEGTFFGKVKNMILAPRSILDAAAPAGAGPSAANKTVEGSLAFKHLKDTHQWWSVGAGVMRGAVFGENEAYAPTSMAGKKTGLSSQGLAPSMGLDQAGAVHSVVRRGDRKRQKNLEEEAKAAIRAEKHAEAIKNAVEKIEGLLDEQFQ